jgi:hypothetical protein
VLGSVGRGGGYEACGARVVTLLAKNCCTKQRKQGDRRCAVTSYISGPVDCYIHLQDFNNTAHASADVSYQALLRNSLPVMLPQVPQISIRGPHPRLDNRGKGKGKVHPRTGHEGQRGSRDTSLHFL